jgi:transcriptional regulator with XRE-family HTH domain
VDWKVIRAAFVRARGRRKQAVIAKAGGLHQSAISKLESNDNLGPAVEIFIKAVEGLGLTPSAFFAELERSQNPPLQRDHKEPQDLRGGPSQSEAHHGGSVPASRTYTLTEEDLLRIGRIAGAAALHVNRRETADRQTPSPSAARPPKRRSRARHD